MLRKHGNRPQADMTAEPKKYPQGYFKDKPCKWCGTVFSPQAPSHLYCSQECANKASSSKYYKRNYGLHYRDVESLFNRQGGVCAICHTEGFDMMDPEEGMIVVDHCHETGRVRGLLCHNCNRALGLLQDSKDIIRNAWLYLEGATTIPLGSTPKRAEAPSPSDGG